MKAISYNEHTQSVKNSCLVDIYANEKRVKYLECRKEARKKVTKKDHELAPALADLLVEIQTLTKTTKGVKGKKLATKAFADFLVGFDLVNYIDRFNGKEGWSSVIRLLGALFKLTKIAPVEIVRYLNDNVLLEKNLISVGLRYEMVCINPQLEKEGITSILTDRVTDLDTNAVTITKTIVDVVNDIRSESESKNKNEIINGCDWSTITLN